MIILASHEYRDSYAFNVQTGDTIAFPRDENEALSGFQVSSDHANLAYQLHNSNGSDWSLVVSSSPLTREIMINRKDLWRGLVAWHDDKNLLISQTGTGELETLLLLNPFTKEEVSLPGNFPDIYWLYPHPFWGNYSLSLTVYDRTLTRVVFPRFSSTGSELILWDVDANHEIASVSSTAFFGKTPKWSPDGQTFLIAGSISGLFPEGGDQETDQELFKVSLTGKKTQLTYLTSFYTQSIIGSYSWSDDGKRVAFWHSDPSNSIWEQLAVVDAETKTVTNYCVPGAFGLSDPPVWSADGRFIAIENIEGGFGSELDSRVLLVDLQELVVYHIADNLTPVGWLTSP